jgi:hypothetical protein
MTSAWFPWRRASAGIAAVGIAGALCPAAPASAEPAGAPAGAPCARAERYAAEAGAELLRLNRLDLRPTGRADAPVTDVGLAAARSALVAQSAVNSAAAARLLDGQPTGRTAPAAMTRQVHQQAPPTNPAATVTRIPAQDVGPLSVGAGALSTHARWDAPMACGSGTGEVTRATSSAGSATILGGKQGQGGEQGPGGSSGRALVGVPNGLQSLSTTALERRGANVHTVARASVATKEIRLLGDAVRVRVVRAPRLTTSISANDGSADVRYTPPVLQVSGQGFTTRRLDTPGDQLELALQNDPPRTESASAVPGDPLRTVLSALRPGALLGLAAGGSGAPGGLTADSDGPDLPGLPPRPGVPELTGTTAEPQDADDDPVVRISVGEVHQAVSGHAVAARVVSVHIQIVAGPTSGGPTGKGSGSAGGTVLDLDVGTLEAAAVAPDPGMAGGVAAQGDAVDGGVGGAGGGLPVTGSRIDLMVYAGGALLIGGIVFLVFGLRRHRFRA